MSLQLLMMVHAATGVLAMLAGLWLFLDTLNLHVVNRARLRVSAVLVAVLMWATYFLGGYWYVNHYGPEKAIIVGGPWPAAHGFFMETKEHVFLILLLLATWLPIAVFRGNLYEDRANRTPVLWGSGLLVLGTLAMEGAGALVSMGVKLALLPA